jgi:hypothetical protein
MKENKGFLFCNYIGFSLNSDHVTEAFFTIARNSETGTNGDKETRKFVRQHKMLS